MEKGIRIDDGKMFRHLLQVRSYRRTRWALPYSYEVVNSIQAMLNISVGPHRLIRCHRAGIGYLRYHLASVLSRRYSLPQVSPPPGIPSPRCCHAGSAPRSGTCSL